MLHSPENLPLPLYSAAQVRELDARLIAAGTPGFELMSRAAHAIWRTLRRRWPGAGVLTVLAGRGNNAGDGYLVAALALRAGWRVQVLAVGDAAHLQGDAALPVIRRWPLVLRCSPGESAPNCRAWCSMLCLARACRAPCVNRMPRPSAC